MRAADSLDAGVSRFFREVEKLQQIVAELDAAREGATVLFLLDEVLAGTNSRERVIGSRAVVRELVRRGAIGAVSSHDLGLARLEAELGGRIRNVHLEDRLEAGTMCFDYVLREGPVATSNALRLMRAVGLDLDYDEEVEPVGAPSAAPGDAREPPLEGDAIPRPQAT
jgi:DNA mismatch repair ATPase MutS